MTAAQHDLTCEQGTTFIKTLTIKNSSSVVRDLSAHAARMQVRPDITSSTKLLDLTSAGGDITLNSSGVIEVTVSATATAALGQGGVYDLEIEAAGVVERVIEGDFNLSKEVTR
ncbi:MAG: hypothetical protein HOI21_10880 [Bacteroidetes Order II. Incertae sedis bacterium]|nr:hypothetical protein [Bacteroidetes Order II. bacterium]